MSEQKKIIPISRFLYDTSIQDLPFLSLENSNALHHETLLSNLIQQMLSSSIKRVFIYSHDRLFFLIAFLAACQSGKEIHLPHTVAPLLLKKIMHDKDLLLTDNHDNFDQKIICVHKNKFRCLNPSEISVVFYTSGTTGLPKAIPKTLKQLEIEVETLNSMWGSGVERFLSTVVPCHIYGLLFSLLWPVCIQKPFFRETFIMWDTVNDLLKEADVLVSSPAHLNRFSQMVANGVRPHPKIIFSSGSYLSYQTAQQVHHYFGCLPVEVYGSTETGGIAYRQQETPQKPWQIFPHVKLRQKSSQGVMLKSPYILNKGYMLLDDKIEMVNQHTFHLLGRADRTVKIEGKRIALCEIENQLCQHTFVSQAFVLLLDNTQRDEMGAVISLTLIGKEQLRSSNKITLVQQLKKYLKAYFDVILIPRKWKIVNQFPVNTQGKITYNDFLPLFNEKIDS